MVEVCQYEYRLVDGFAVLLSMVLNFKVVQIQKVSSLGTPKPPSLLRQLSKPYEVVAGR